MTPQELDRKLRALNPHEEQYRKGIPPAPDVRAHVTIDGIDIVKSSFDINGDLSCANPKAESSSTSLQRIRIKRHSRFRTYPLHFHDFVELAYMYDGACMETVNNRLLGLRKGQVLLVDSDTTHTISPLHENDILVNVQIDKSYFTMSFFNRLDPRSLVTSFFVNAISKGVAHNNFILFHSENSRRLPLFMNELMCELSDPSPYNATMVDGLFSLVIAELIAIYRQNAADGSQPIQSSIVPILGYIESHYQKCTLSDVARQFNMSTSSLTKMLKCECGKSFKELLQSQRIAVAKRLLLQDTLSVTSVAHHVGYSNMRFFYEIFSRECGMTPGEYRAHLH